MGNIEPEPMPQDAEPDLPSAPDPDLIRTIEETDMSGLPESADPDLTREIELEDPAVPLRVYIEGASDDE